MKELEYLIERMRESLGENGKCFDQTTEYWIEQAEDMMAMRVDNQEGVHIEQEVFIEGFQLFSKDYF